MASDAPPPSKKVKKCRQYDLSYLEFGFIPSPNDNTKPMCLICGSLFSNEAMKPSRLKDHLTRLHPSKLNADFKKIKADWEKQRNIKALFAKRDIRLENGLTASYNISLMIAKTGMPHTIGEKLILPCVKEVIETVMCQSSTPVLSTVPLSNDTVQRRIDEMGDEVESQLVQILSRTDHALQIDESTIRDNEALLMGYVRFVHEKETKEEMLFVISLPSDTKAISLFEAVKDFYEVKGIPMQNIIQCATDGAPAMVGRHRGFIALMKREIPGLIAIHCLIHRHHLAAKHVSGELHDTLDFIVKCINRIKAKSLNDRLFRLLCQDNDEDFERLLLHTEVRWLSKGACLTRFYILYDTVMEFFEEMLKDKETTEKLIILKNDVAYLSDIFFMLNESNKQLKGNNMTMVNVITLLPHSLINWNYTNPM